MAGIGFELKKLFSRRGIAATVRAYGYASMVCAGPMILGFCLLIGSMLLADCAGASRHEQDLLVAMLTHALLFSMIATSVLSLLTTRYCADMIYQKRYDKLMPSLYGSLAILLTVGGLGYGVFLYFCGVELIFRALSFVLFMVLIVVWTEMNYLTMLKDYKSIVIVFAVSLVAALGMSALFIWVLHIRVITALFGAITLGYGIMMIWYFLLLYRYLPDGFGTSMRFLCWIDTMPELVFTGIFMNAGLFAHLVIMWWCSPLQVQVEGLFYGAPNYDVPAIVAFFSVLITTVSFVTSVETRLYPKYKEYFSLFNDGGSIENLNESEENMLRVLHEELGYLALKQIFTTLIFITLGNVVLPLLPLGMTPELLRIYRTLCVGYAFYAIGNSIMLVSQYFADLRGPLLSSALFAVVAVVASMVQACCFDVFYGFGFLIGSAVFCFCSWMRLCLYLSKLKYHVLSKQPVMAVKGFELFGRLTERLEQRAERIQKRRMLYNAQKKGDLQCE